MTVAANTQKVDEIYSKVAPQDNKISFRTLYNTYAKPIIRDEVRQIIAEYSINNVASSREVISDELFEKVAKALESTLILVKLFGLADVQFPQIIPKVKEAAAERRERIERKKRNSKFRKCNLSVPWKRLR